MTEFTLEDVVRFARDRHTIWEGGSVDDKILTRRKFTNVFRVIDRGSQYLLNLMNTYEDPADRLALSYFYRQVNRPETMEAIISHHDGYVPTFADLMSPSFYDRVVKPVFEERSGAFLSGAYMILIMTNDSRSLMEKMRAIFPAARPYLLRVAGEPELEGRVRILRETPGLGPFLSMQIATDLGYCEGEPDQENSFILPGPGSRKGVKYISKQKAEQVIRSFPVEELPPLPHSNGRPPSLMDIQNVFCEFSKYARLVERQTLITGPEYRRGTPFPVKIPSQFVR